LYESLIITTLVRSQGSVISIVTRLQILLPEGVRDLPLLQSIETEYGALPTSPQKASRGPSPELKRPGREAIHSSLSNAEIRNK